MLVDAFSESTGQVCHSDQKVISSAKDLGRCDEWRMSPPNSLLSFQTTRLTVSQLEQEHLRVLAELEEDELDLGDANDVDAGPHLLITAFSDDEGSNNGGDDW